MKIQYISYIKENIKNFECSTFSSPKSFDTFDINIINLNSERIWKNNINLSTEYVDCYRDFININDIIKNSTNSVIIYILPQDLEFKYGSSHYSIELKNIIKDFLQILSKYLGLCNVKLNYENNETNIGDIISKSSFYFNNRSTNALTKSLLSNKVTTIKYDHHIIITSLNISSYDEIISFLKEIKLIDSINDLPEWVKEYTFHDDASLKQSNKEIDGKIEELQLEKNNNISLLAKNNYYKSILISSGDDLVKTVFDILGKILNHNFEDFTDIKKEDFRFEYNNTLFIGEIKGVNENVKNKHISQLDNHLDDLEYDEVIFTPKKLLIINHQRKSPLVERAEVDPKQIDKAIRDDVLIIETITLLKLYERFLNDEITKEEVYEIFRDKTGLLKI